MGGSAAVARALVDYDPQLAESVLRLLARELGVPAVGEVARVQSELERATVDDAAAKTTLEWKQGFAHVERVRSLAVEISKLI